MAVEIRVPSLGESVAEATVAKWFKQIGDVVTEDEPIVELETDKVTLEFNAPASGTLAEILVDEGGDVEVGALLGSIDQDGAAAKPAAPKKEAASGKADGSLSPAVRKLIDEHGLDAELDHADRTERQHHQGRCAGRDRGRHGGPGRARGGGSRA